MTTQMTSPVTMPMPYVRCLWASIGLSSLVSAWVGSLPDLADQAFFAHMMMHMLVVAIAAPCLSLAVADTPIDPAILFPRLFSPIPATIFELVVVWAWHAPGLHHVARMTSWGLEAEQGSFLIAGIFVWSSCCGGDRRHNLGRTAAGVVGLLLTAMHMTLLGALLSLASRPVYDHHQGYGSLNALEDQQLGGAIMLVIGGLVYLAGGVWLASRLLRETRLAPVEGVNK